MNTPSQSSSMPAYLGVDLFDELGIDNFSAEERMQFLESFLFTIYMRVMHRIMEETTEEDQKQLTTLINQRPMDFTKLRMFLATKFPSFDEIEKEEVSKYKKELLEDMKLHMPANG